MNDIIIELLQSVSLIDKVVLILIFIGIYFGKEWMDKKRNKNCMDGVHCSNEHCDDHKQLTEDVIKVRDDIGEIKIECAKTSTNIKWIKDKICNN